MSHYGAYIAGTGSYVPEKRLTNDDLAKVVDIYLRALAANGFEERLAKVEAMANKAAEPRDSTPSEARPMQKLPVNRLKSIEKLHQPARRTFIVQLRPGEGE